MESSGKASPWLGVPAFGCCLQHENRCSVYISVMAPACARVSLIFLNKNDILICESVRPATHQKITLRRWDIKTALFRSTQLREQSSVKIESVFESWDVQCRDPTTLSL